MTRARRPRESILLVEDDVSLASMLRDRLTGSGYTVWHAQNAAEAEMTVREVEPDLIMLDLMLPDANGLVLCANLRETQTAPIIICSASDRKDDAVLSLKLGAVDFVHKPFSSDELEARVETALRRADGGRPDGAPVAPNRSEPTLLVGPLAIDQARRRVTLGSHRIHVTPIEYRLLCALAGRPNVVVSWSELADEVWGCRDSGIRRSAEVHLRRLRAKLLSGPTPGPALLNVRGFGYQLAWEPGEDVAASA